MLAKYIKFTWDNNYSIFSTEKYLKSTGSEYGWIGGFTGGSLKFVLPFIVKRKFFFRYLQFQTATIYLDPNLTINDEKDFLNSAVKFLSKEEIDFIIQPPTYAVFKIYPDNAVFAPFGSYIVDLSLNEDDLWSNVHQKHKNVIRRAVKNDVIIERGTQNLSSIHSMLVQTMARADMVFESNRDFCAFINELGNNVEIFTALYNGEPQGCAVFPFSSHSAYYLWGGSVEKPFLGALNLLHWEAMKYFKGLRVSYYDFVGARLKPVEGSKLEGIQRFKSRFGATMNQGYLWKMPLNKWKYNLYRYLLMLKNRKEAVDIIEQEIYKEE